MANNQAELYREDRLYTNPLRTPEGILDATRLTTGELSDTLYTRLFWAVQGRSNQAGQEVLLPYLEQLGEFFVDYCWAIPDESGPTDRLIRAMDTLLRLEASGEGWASQQAKELLAVAINAIQNRSVGLGHRKRTDRAEPGAAADGGA